MMHEEKVIELFNHHPKIASEAKHASIHGKCCPSDFFIL